MAGLDAFHEMGWKHLGKRISFYTPGFAPNVLDPVEGSSVTFPPISVTGRSCALGCKHCAGKLLRSMIPAVTPSQLIRVCERLAREGCMGCLITGGCGPDGSVPLKGFVEAIAYVKGQLGLRMAVHTGLVDRDTVMRLRAAGVDSALLDIVGSDETIREVCHLNATVKDYELSLRNLREAGIHLVPHLVVGLHYGQLRGEMKALDIIAANEPSAVIIIVFTPLKGTPMGGFPPPAPGEVAYVLNEARLKLPRTPLALGCMRPQGLHRVETDILAVKAGVNAIAFPSREAVALSRSMGLETSFSPLCCSQVYERT